MVSGRTLGVHVRGTDFRRNYKGHPVAVTTQEYLEAAVKMAEQYHFDRIFLATDDSNAVRIFQDTFGEKVSFYQDVVRSEGNETVMRSESDRPLHHYQLGLEVLRDAYTLAACNALLAGKSQVSFGARVLAGAAGNEYENVTILDKGINATGEICK